MEWSCEFVFLRYEYIYDRTNLDLHSTRKLFPMLRLRKSHRSSRQRLANELYEKFESFNGSNMKM